MVADSGYTTRENIEKMAGREIDFLGTMRHEDVPRGANLPNRFPPSAFLYQPERNRCVCPEGKVLHPQGRTQGGSRDDLPPLRSPVGGLPNLPSQTGVLPRQSRSTAVR